MVVFSKRDGCRCATEVFCDERERAGHEAQREIEVRGIEVFLSDNKNPPDMGLGDGLMAIEERCADCSAKFDSLACFG
jgi:hypothetical protein